MSLLRPREARSSSPVPEGLASAMLESLADPVLACDAEGTIVVANQSARTILGSSGDPVPADEWAERCPIYRLDGTPVTRTEELPLGRALRGEDVRDVQLEVRPAGKQRIMNVSGSPVRGPGGEIRGAVIIMREVTDRLALEHQLRLEGAIAANAADGIALIRASDGLIVYTNDRWDRMFGYDTGELAGRHVSVVHAPVDQAPEERAEEIRRALERSGTWTGEVHSVRKDGGLFWTSASVSTFEHPEHGLVWVAAQADMTDRRLADEKLREAEERFRQVFENGPVASLVMDGDMRILDANGACREITGYRHHELVGMRLSAIARPDDAELEIECEASLAAAEIPRYRLDKRLVTKNGDAVRVKQTTSLVRGSDAEALYRVATIEPLG